jgi:cytidine deaminase
LTGNDFSARKGAGSMDPETGRITPEELLQYARKARDKSYSPYSGFPVGAAVLSTDGEVASGCNIENVSFSISMCAERNAMASFQQQGFQDPLSIAIAGIDGIECYPCGACRQFLHEFNPSMQVVLDNSGEPKVINLQDLFPLPFDNASLKGKE